MEFHTAISERRKYADFNIAHSESYDIMHHIETTKNQSIAETK